jgi:hypothetical protein
MGSDGDDRLGGADFDTSVAHHLTQQHSSVLENLSAYNNNNSNNMDSATHDDDMAELLASSCDRITDDLPLCSVSSFHTLGEKVKISLSEQQQQQTDGETQQEFIVARTKCLALPPLTAETKLSSLESMCESLYEETLEMTLEEFDEVCNPLFDRSVIPATRLVEDLTLQMKEIDEIVMVGGTTRMPQIRELVRQAFPDAQLNTHIDPDITVVRNYRNCQTPKSQLSFQCLFAGVLLCLPMTILLDAWLLMRGLGAGVVAGFTFISLLMIAVSLFPRLFVYEIPCSAVLFISKKKHKV